MAIEKRKTRQEIFLRAALATLVCLTLTISSCDCITEGNGVILDSDTNNPLDSVAVKFYINKAKSDFYESEMLTDSTGAFYGSTGLTGGGINSCPDLVIEISKTGYLTEQITNPNNDTIYMTRN